MRMNKITESLYSKYNLSNADIKSNKNKVKKLHEDFDFENENRDLYNKFVETAERFGFDVIGSGVNYIELKKDYNDYILEIDIDVEDPYDVEITFSSTVFLPNGNLFESKDGFDDLLEAIDWGERIIIPRAQLLYKIRKLINDSNVENFTSEELESLSYYLTESINFRKNRSRKRKPLREDVQHTNHINKILNSVADYLNSSYNDCNVIADRDNLKISANGFEETYNLSYEMVPVYILSMSDGVVFAYANTHDVYPVTGGQHLSDLNDKSAVSHIVNVVRDDIRASK